jgi:predicted transcriptional regulator
MEKTMVLNPEKVTFHLSKELKDEMLQLKNELGTTLSDLYNEAIREFLNRKELEKWKRGSALAEKDLEYKNSFIDIEEDFVEY